MAGSGSVVSGGIKAPTYATGTTTLVNRTPVTSAPKPTPQYATGTTTLVNRTPITSAPTTSAPKPTYATGTTTLVNRTQAPTTTPATTALKYVSGNGSSGGMKSYTSGNGSSGKTINWGNTSPTANISTTAGSSGGTSTGVGIVNTPRTWQEATSGATVSSNVKIAVNTTAIEANIKKINSIVEQLESVWNDIKVNQIAAVNSSWVGSVATAYTEKVTNMEPKITAACNSLKLIANTYSSAINEINSKEDELAGQIKNS